MTSALPFLAPPRSGRDRHWDDCRNALGIARLLLRDGRPITLVETSCRMAIEAGCRAALEQAGGRFDGDVERALMRLAAPRELIVLAAPPGEGDAPAATAAEPVAACERVLGWLAAYLRSEAPDRAWGI